MKKSFTGPVWLLLIFALLQMLALSISLRQIVEGMPHSGEGSLISAAALLRFFMWPLIFLLEALVYWLIRRRNSFRALSWTHSVLFVLSFLLISFFNLIGILSYRPGKAAEYRVNRQIMMHEQTYLFFGLVILAHVAFVAVLANCLRATAAVERNEGQAQDQENLLDDVVL